MHRRANYLAVAAIDIGTTFSGYAFSFRSDFEANPLKIHMNNWESEGVSNPEMKAPSVVLLNPDQSFNSFGYRASTNYTELLEEPEEARTYFYVQNFKMQLYDRAITLDMVIKDINDRDIPAIIVFTESIRFLKDHLMTSFQTHLGSKSPILKDILFVITVPAIWSDAAKQFMRVATEKAGIESHNVILAYEPEAAALHCSILPEDQAMAKYFEKGRKLMIVDLGGGTVDLTVVNIIDRSNKLTYFEHVYKVSGGAWGGNKVNDNFRLFLDRVLGEKVISKFKTNFHPLYLEMFNDFEIQKKTVSIQGRSKIGIKISGELVELYKNMTSKVLKDELERQFKGKVKLSYDKIQFDVTYFEIFFKDAIAKICGHINKTFSQRGCVFPSAIILVGGFSEAKLIRESIKTHFPVIKDIISPFGSSLSVLKGAVVFGHNPSIVTGRVCRETIGVALHRPYIPNVHVKEKTFKLGGKLRVDDCFEKIFSSEEVIKIGQIRTIEVHDLHNNQELQSRRTHPKVIEIYSSLEKDPQYTTDPGCIMKGRITVNPPNGKWPDVVEGFIEMEAGGTEIIVRYRDKDNLHFSEGQIDFI